MKPRSQKIYLILMVALFLAAIGLYALNERAARRQEAALPQQLAPLRATALRLDSLLHHVWLYESATDAQRNLMKPYIGLMDALDRDPQSPEVRSRAAALLPGMSQKPTAQLTTSLITESLIARIYALQDSITRLNIAPQLISMDLAFQDYLKTGDWHYHAISGYVPYGNSGWIVAPEWYNTDTLNGDLLLSYNSGVQAVYTHSTAGLIPAGQDSAVISYLVKIRKDVYSDRKDSVAGTFVVVR